MSDLFSAGASIASAKMSADAQKSAANTQVKALEKQRDFVFANLNPEAVQEVATQADIQQAKGQIALQSQVDPALLQMRYVAEQNMLKAAQEGAGSQGDILASQLFEETLPKDAKQEQLKQKLMDAAIAEIDAGATLPADVQAELVKAGLERSGTVGTGTGVRGMSGQLTRKLIGNEALALKAARQQQAIQLGTAASVLQNQRLNALASVFPALKNLQTTNISQQSGMLGTSTANLPDYGLGGTQMAGILQSRVGMTNQLANSAAQVKANAALQVANAWTSAASAMGNSAGSVAGNAGLGSTGSLLAQMLKSKPVTPVWGNVGTGE